MSKMLTESKSMSVALPPEGFVLESGDALPELRFAYETYGALAEDKRNTVLVLHALTGDAHAAGYYTESDKRPGWWDPLIGPGKGIDTDRYFVVCANVLGGCKGTTGPSSTNPATGKPYGVQFPHISVADTVAAEKRFLDQLGIPELFAVVGGSLGGMRALQWSISYPDYVKRCVCIAAAVHLLPQALAFDIIGRQEIESDPNWQEGDYYASDVVPDGLARARQIGHVTYLSSASMRLKFGRDTRDDPEPGRRSKFSTDFQVESYLNHQGKKFVDRFDANSYLYLSRMLDLFDLPKRHGSVREAFAATTCRFMLVSISSDWLFPPSQQQEIVAALLAERKDVSYFNIDSEFGHDAFLLEYDTLGRGVSAFLNGSRPAGAPAPVDRRDLDHISELIPDGVHILDVGSGDGSMMLALEDGKRISGVCLDRNFDEVVSCMAKGLTAIQLDADTGLRLVQEGAFDCILLNQTIQQLHSALQTVKEMLRIAGRCVIGFPNFAYYRCRLELLFSGRLPVSETLPFQWYDTPNIHLVTLRDFQDLCDRRGMRVEQIRYVSDSGLGRFMVALGLPNIGAERAVALVRSAE